MSFGAPSKYSVSGVRNWPRFVLLYLILFPVFSNFITHCFKFKIDGIHMVQMTEMPYLSGAIRMTAEAHHAFPGRIH
jgi:hypothetical protein